MWLPRLGCEKMMTSIPVAGAGGGEEGAAYSGAGGCLLLNHEPTL